MSCGYLSSFHARNPLYGSTLRRTHHIMATGCDAPRARSEDERTNESLGAIRARTSAGAQTAVIAGWGNGLSAGHVLRRVAPDNWRPDGEGAGSRARHGLPQSG